MIITKKHLSRRTFLRGTFGATMALPLLDAMVPALTAQSRTAAASPFRFGVVYMPCGSLPVTSVIDRIEAETGLPVVTCVQAQVHACLSRAGYDQPIEGYGRLLRQLGQAVPA